MPEAADEGTDRTRTQSPPVLPADARPMAHPEVRPDPYDSLPARLPPPVPTPEQRLEQLARVLANATAGDFSEKLDLPERELGLEDRVVILARFLLEDLERAQHARNREIERLREIDQMKSRFINTAAHELGTPLTPLKLQVHLLHAGQLGPLTPPQRRAVGIVSRNLGRVAMLVGDLLSISRMDAGELKLRKVPFDLAALVSETFDTFVDGARERGITLRHEVPDGLFVDGDPARLGQVLYNLTNNALKFTPSGGTVMLRARARGHEALVQVQDTGIGLTSDEIARLAQPFVKLADTSPHGDPGTGLGLYITKGLVERHGGLLWLESGGKGHGTTASFAIPLLKDLPGTVRKPDVGRREKFGEEE